MRPLPQRIIGCLLVVLGIMVVVAPNLAAQPVQLAIVSQDATPGSTVNVPIAFVDNGHGASTLLFTINFDGALLDCTSVTFSLPAGYSRSAPCSDNAINFSVFFFGQNPPPIPDGPIASIAFTTGTPPGPAQAALTFANLSCASPSGDVPCEGSDGTVRIVVNRDPVAQDDTATTPEDTASAPIRVLANDTDADNDALTVTTVSAGRNGTTSTNGRTIVYTPAANFNGQDTFTYTISDGQGGTATASVSVTVTAVNDAPMARDDTARTREDTASAPIRVLANDTDADNDALTVTTVSAGRNGTTSTNGRTIVYTPAANFNGQDTFTYIIGDGNGGTATATVTVTVTAVNDAPEARDDIARTREDTASAPIRVLANDTDVDGDTLTVTTVSAGSNGTTRTNGTTVVYTPAPGFVGTDTFTYTISDGQGSTASASVTVTVEEVPNTNPVAADDQAETPEDTPTTIDILANDSDADGDPLTVTAVTQPENGTVVSNNDGTVTYTPAANFNGEDTFTYTIGDGQGGTASATVTVTVTDVNDPPVANPDMISVRVNTARTINVLGNDTDVDGTLDPTTVTVTSAPTSGGTATVNPNGTITYTPGTDFLGVDTFTYTVADDDGDASADATVTVMVVDNLPPEARDDTANTDEEVAIAIMVLRNDRDNDGTLNPATVRVTRRPANGTALANADGTITYTPADDFAGQDTFMYQVSDNEGALSNAATVTVAVAEVNDPPVAADDMARTVRNRAVTVNVLDNDTDIDGTLVPGSVQITAEPGNGTVTANPNGSITYTPATDFVGFDTFAYTVADDDGAPSQASTVTITIRDPTNTDPMAVADTPSTDEDTPVTINVIDNDTDADADPLTVIAVTQPANGSVVDNGDGTVDYTPNVNFNGIDTFTYMITDGRGGSGTATVTVTVNAVNDLPVAANDASTTAEELAVAINVLANDTDGDDDPLTVMAVDNGTGGTTATDGTVVTYTPNADFAGTDTFTYTVSDGNGGTATAMVTVTVTPVNDAPVAQDDTATTTEDTTSTPIRVLANDTDVDGDTLTVTTVSAGTNGTTRTNGRTIVYTPARNFNGPDTFTYTISDGNGATATATVAITVTPVNDDPVLPGDLPGGPTPGNTDLVINVLASANDIDNDTLTIAAITQGANGTVVDNGNGTVTYTPDPGFVGTDSFTVTIHDGQGGMATTTITVTVENIPSVARDDTAITSRAVAITIPVLDNDTDANSDPLTVLTVTPGENGTTTTDSTTVTYTPNADFIGEDTFTYTIGDGRGDTATATVVVTVSPIRLTTPQAGNVVAGNAVAVAVLDADAPLEATAVRFQFRAVGATAFTDIGVAMAPALFVAAWDTTTLADGDYELRALARFPEGAPRPSPLVRVTVNNSAPAGADIVENVDVKDIRVPAAVPTQVVTSNGVLVDIPARALTAADILSIRTLDEAPPRQPGMPAARFVDIQLASGPADFPEANPLLVSVPYSDTAPSDGVVDGTDIPETTLTLWFFDDAGDAWVQVPEATVDPVANTITGMVTHLTLFGVFTQAAETPLVVIRGSRSPSGTVQVTLPVTNLVVAQLQLATSTEAVTIDSVRVAFQAPQGDAELLGALTVQVIQDANGDGTVNTGEPVLGRQTVRDVVSAVTVALRPPLQLSAETMAHLLVALNLSEVPEAARSSGAVLPPPTTPSQLAWFLMLPPVVGIILWSRRRRGSSRFSAGILLLVLCCSVLLTSCPDDDAPRELRFTTAIPAGAVRGRAAASGPVAAPTQPIPGPEVLVLE